jgi:hypothetical protein
MTYLYKVIIVIVNNPATNPISAKVMADISIAFPPWRKKDVPGDVFLSSSSSITSSTGNDTLYHGII